MTGRQVVGDRAEHHRRHEREGPDQEHRPQEHPGERQVVGRRVPVVCGTRFFAARNPARASGRTSAGNRPSSRTIPVATFHAGLLSPRPSNPEPLLAAAEVNS